MIEREFIKNKVRDLNIQKEIGFIVKKNASIGSIIVEKTPLSETITIDAVRPGIIIGRRGEVIKRITSEIKRKYKLDNPQIKVREIAQPFLNARAVAERIASTLERFGSARFKSTGHRSVSSILSAGALGAEIILSGKLPGKRARSWRFYDGYMKKCGEISDVYVDKAIEYATLPSGVIGIKVSIMREDVPLPDKITIFEPKESVEEIPKIAIKAAEKTETKLAAAEQIKKSEAATVNAEPAKKAVVVKKTVAKKESSSKLKVIISKATTEKETKKK